MLKIVTCNSAYVSWDFEYCISYYCSYVLLVRFRTATLSPPPLSPLDNTAWNFMLPTGAVVHVVEIDPIVISASIQAMGFPSFSLTTPSGARARSNPYPIDEVLWKGVHERLHLYEADAENFILSTPTLYDMVFIDAYDGEDIFPHKLWDPQSPFLLGLEKRLHLEHGTVVVNLHSDTDLLNEDGSEPSDHQGILPMGRYVSSVCRSYRDVLIGDRSGLAFTVAAPWVCNSSLVVCRGFKEGDVAMNNLMSKSLEVESMLNLPFSCLQYLKRGFVLVD